MNLNLKNMLFDKLKKYRNLGYVEFVDGTISIAKIPNKEQWFLFHFYSALDNERIISMEKQLNRFIPNLLKEFYKIMNGADLFSGLFEIWGSIGPARKDMPNFQPISLVNGNQSNLARFEMVPDNIVFFGSYSGWISFYVRDGDSKIYACNRVFKSLEPIKIWDSFEIMLRDLLAEFTPYFNDEGQPITDDILEKPIWN
jgi:SMI1-KNR4 cell-wall